MSSGTTGTIEISAQAVQQLREKTGLGLMQCKRALMETGGDIEAAIEFLRKQGAAVAAKRSDRETKEGKIVFGHDSSGGATVSAVEINCETDFVASSDDFVAFAAKVARAVAIGAPADLNAVAALPVDGTTLAEVNTAVIAKIGEKISIRRFAVEKLGANEIAETYSHMGGKIGVLIKLAFDGEVKEVKDPAALTGLAKDLAMQVAASAPLSIDPSGIPAATVEKEREIARELTAKEGKTGEMLERIVEGKLNKFFKENCLLQQVFVKDNKTPIDKHLAATARIIGVENLRVAAFHRLQLGQ